MRKVTNSIRNKDGFWINSQVFREPALHYDKYGYYCNAKPGSYAFRQYWDEELRRMREGYEVAGCKITGYHYAYLNYNRIQLAKKINDKVAQKIEFFPDFWDGDYTYFWTLDIARYGVESCAFFDLEPYKKKYGEGSDEYLKAIFNKFQLLYDTEPQYLTGGYHVCVGKARRKGYSYKNASICATNYHTKRGSKSAICAYEEKYCASTMDMVNNYLDWFNSETAFYKSRDEKDRLLHKKASKKVIDSVTGSKTYKGYKSEIFTRTFKDNPDPARGLDCDTVLFEESGAFGSPGLLRKSIKAVDPVTRAGKFLTGQMVIFGTSGDLESGTADFAHIFYNPLQFNMFPVINEWDLDVPKGSKCSFFHANQWNYEGYYDDQGNSFVQEALQHELDIRDKMIEDGATSTDLQQRGQEYPTCPSEAFLMTGSNSFPVIEIRKRIENLNNTKLYKRLKPATLYMKKDGSIGIEYDLENKLKPLYKIDEDSASTRKGAVCIYKEPVTTTILDDEGNKKEIVPKNAYLIGFDPYRQDEGPSNAAIYVVMPQSQYSSHPYIAAKYVGRMENADDVTRIFMYLCMLYNSEGMYENEVTHIKPFFTKEKKLSYLASQPQDVINANIYNSKTKRVYGCHMNDKLKRSGEKYMNSFLRNVVNYDEEGKPITFVNSCYDIGFLQECLKYNSKENFDRMMAMFQVMFQYEQRSIDEIDEIEKIDHKTLGKELIELENLRRSRYGNGTF